jgi:hypothetical protein
LDAPGASAPCERYRWTRNGNGTFVQAPKSTTPGADDGGLLVLMQNTQIEFAAIGPRLARISDDWLLPTRIGVPSWQPEFATTATRTGELEPCALLARTV